MLALLRRGTHRALMVVDILTAFYHTDNAESLAHAVALCERRRRGAVKVEGGERRLD